MLCKEFGWTYDELMSQPHDFIENCIAYLDQISIEKQKALKRR